MTALARFISTRSPYDRAGLAFNRSCKRTGAGHPYVDVDLVGLELLGEAGWRDLVADPAISIELRNAAGEFEPFTSMAALREIVAPNDRQDAAPDAAPIGGDAGPGLDPGASADHGPAAPTPPTPSPADRGASRRGASRSHRTRA